MPRCAKVTAAKCRSNMSRRLGNHRVRPARSEANRARPQIERIERELKAAYARHDAQAIARLETERAWAIGNSLR